MMNSAGMLTTNWMSNGLASAKWALMAFKAGATAATDTLTEIGCKSTKNRGKDVP